MSLSSDALSSVLDLARREHTGTLTVPDLADHAGYSPFHFSRLFTAAMRITPGQYPAALRIDTAKRLLMTADDPVIDCAVAAGLRRQTPGQRPPPAGSGESLGRRPSPAGHPARYR